MNRTWLGHSTFLITNDAGRRLVTDPADGKTVPVMKRTAADVITVSHRHFDHCAVDRIEGEPVVKESLAQETLSGFTITGFSTFHDEVRGAKRGPNTVFLIEADDERYVHCGDLGHIPDEATIAAIRGCDILFLPVGGIFTVDGKTAWEIAKLVAPKTVVPMHFQTPDLGFTLEPIEHFLAAAKDDPAPIAIEIPSRA